MKTKKDYMEMSKEQLVKEIFKYKKCSLTNMNKREDFEHDIEKLIKERKNFFLIMIDINGLHDINKNNGIDAGDEIIRKTSEIIKEATSSLDRTYRLGGDEFIVISQRKKIDDTLEMLETDIFSFESIESIELVSGKRLIKEVDKKLQIKKEKFYKKNNRRRR